jgi:glycosyltransferase involved in cell wall biosynthesis
MPRLLLPTLEFPPQIGGIAEYLAALARFFGREIEVVVSDMLLWHRLWPRWGKTVFELIKRRQSYETIIVSHLLPIGTAAWLARFFTGLSYVVIVHGMDVGMAKRTTTKRLLAGFVLRGAKLVVANSRSLEEDVRRDFDVTRTIVVYPCVSLPAVRLPPLPKTSLTLLTVARLVARKGHRRVLKALALLKNEGRLPVVRYRIVGDGPEREAIIADVARFDLKDMVSVEPAVPHDQLSQIYVHADLFVMPTIFDRADREGFGTVYLEAAAHGIPSIATDQPGVNEAVLHEKTGLLVRDGDIPALADAIARLLTDQTLRSRLGEAARARVEREFTCDRQFGKLAVILTPPTAGEGSFR